MRASETIDNYTWKATCHNLVANIYARHEAAGGGV